MKHKLEFFLFNRLSDRIPDKNRNKIRRSDKNRNKIRRSDRMPDNDVIIGLATSPAANDVIMGLALIYFGLANDALLRATLAIGPPLL
jgi:hypothetical protein